jgi:hypothetical protein
MTIPYRVHDSENVFLSFNMGWRILVNFIRQFMLKLKTHSGFHDLFLNYYFVSWIILAISLYICI